MSRLVSDSAACCWIPLFALRCEVARMARQGSSSLPLPFPLALLSPDTGRRLWQVSPVARRAGVKPGMTVSQAIGLCPTLKLCEPDPVLPLLLSEVTSRVGGVSQKKEAPQATDEALSIRALANAFNEATRGLDVCLSRLPLGWLHVIFWGGLRGAVAVALALSLPSELAQRDLLQGLVFGVVLFTLLVQGTTAPRLLRWARVEPAAPAPAPETA